MVEKRFIEFATQNTDNGEINNGFNDIETGGWFYTKDSENARKICDLLNTLHEENKELKETIDELRTIDKEKDIEVEHINNIYKAFGFKGLMDYAKEKLYNFGTVREVEEGLWLLATGGWSDNEFWLDCLLDWSFMYAKGHYRATTRGGGHYYSEKPYADIKVILEDLE